MKDRFSDDFYQIVYSNDEKEIFDQCVQSYHSENRLNFLKYLRNEFSHSNLNELYLHIREGIQNLDEDKMYELDIKFERIEKLKEFVLDSIEIIQNKEVNDKVQRNQRAVQNSSAVQKKEFILNLLYNELNERFFNTASENFIAIFDSSNFEPIQWTGTDAELKGLIELLIQKLDFDFGRNVNVETAKRFYKLDGEKSYNIEGLRKATGSLKYKQIINNDPPHEIFRIIADVKQQASEI